MSVALRPSETVSVGAEAHRPQRLGLAGVGWIGRHRMQAIAASGYADVVAICDPDQHARELAAADVPGAAVTAEFEALLDRELDGIVIASPSALHAAQAMAALSKGIAVFCQKPLARTASEVREVIAAAREANRLLAVDLSYRHTRAMQIVRDLIQRGELGAVYAVDLVFHNGYGPDKAWFYDVELSGGGCLIDLGTHLIDLALWSLCFPRVELISSALYSRGELLSRGAGVTEDYATCELRLETGTTVRIVCSWNCPVGADAVIGAQFHGTHGGALFSNVGGSFHDFRAERFTGTGSETLAEPPDDWGGRAAVAWAERLRREPGFDSEVERVLATAQVLDAAYGRDETAAHN